MKQAIAAALGVLAVLAMTAGTARADRIERGVVVSIEAGEAYFDISSSRGLVVGRPARIKRPVALPHPMTGRVVRDELLVGSGVVTLVGEQLSMIQLAEVLDGTIRIGDIVETLVKSDDPAPAAPTPTKPLEPLPEVPRVSPQTSRALKTWNANIGASLEVKVAAWQRFLEDHPGSPYKASIRAHIAALEDMRVRGPGRIVRGDKIVSGLEHQPRRTLDPGEASPVVVATRTPADIVGAWLHHRKQGQDSYVRSTLERDGDGYFRGEVPGVIARAPGIEYFVEVATADGSSGLAVGSPSEPVEVTVEEPTDAGAFRERKNRSRVSVSTDYLDYSTFDRRARQNGSQDHVDTFFQFQADFLFRLRAEKLLRLWGIRVGLGAINGRGGFADEPMSEDAGFNYGYTELEFRILGESAIAARGVAGIGEDGLGFGVEGRVRLGSEDGSNLSFGVSSLEEIGFLSEVRMQWAALREMPLGFSVGVTDRPNRGDLGVRLGADIGWRAQPWFQPTLRVSYQGRSLEHSGVGIGAGMVFDW